VLDGLRRLERSGFRADLFHAHVYQAGVAALVAAKRYRVPLVVSEHSSHFSLGTLQRSAARRARIVFRAADLVCPVSEHLRRSIEASGVRGRFDVVPNPVDTTVFAPCPPRGDRPTALFVGGLDPIKQVDVLIRAFARLGRSDIQLELVGDGAARGELEALAERLGVARAVHFRGYLPREEVARRIALSSFLVLPSRTETFGCVLAEALAVGRPVVATRVGAIPEIVTADNGILVPPADEEALADALARMSHVYSDFDWRMLSSGARDRFGLEAVGRRWDEIYASLTARRD